MSQEKSIVMHPHESSIVEQPEFPAVQLPLPPFVVAAPNARRSSPPESAFTVSFLNTNFFLFMASPSDSTRRAAARRHLPATSGGTCNTASGTLRGSDVTCYRRRYASRSSP